MLDLDLIRRDPDLVRQALRSRGEELAVEAILDLDARRRESIHQADELRGQRNKASQEIGQRGQVPAELLQEMRGVGQRISALEEEVKGIENELSGLLMTIPNIPRDDVPVGPD